MSNPLNGARPVLVKTVSALTSIATVLSLSGAAYLVPLAASAAVPSDYGLTEGNTISASNTNDPDVYIVNALGYKRLFLNPVIFSFYGHLGGFANVKSVSAAARDAFPTSGLFRNCETDAQQVWAVEVTAEDNAVFHKVTMSGDQAVAEDANFFKKVFCINNNEQNWYPKSPNDYTSLSQVPVYSRVPGATPTPVTSVISASLSSDNPASGTLVQGQASADLIHLQFTGTGTVNQISLKRLGVSADATLTNVYLYDGAKRLTDSATVSGGMITFNDASGLFTVNGSKTISVKSDILSTATGETIGVQLTSFTQAGSVAVSTSLVGNLFTIATATLATVVLAADASISPTTNTALDPGSDAIVWQDTATVGVRSVWLKSVQFRVIGSVNVGDLQNFRFYVDGVQQGVAQAQTDANGYVIFDLSSAPVKLETGGRVLKVLADIVGGSSKNFTVSIRQAPDIATTDSQYNAGVLATQTGNFPAEAGQQTITQGTLTITKKTDSPAGDVVKDASGVVLARFEFKANGERLKVENLRASFTASDASDGLRNGALFADGVQIGSTKTLYEDTASGSANTLGYTEYSLGSSLIIVPGVPRIVEIRADIFDASGGNDISAGDTITANLAVGSSNVQRLVSLNYFSSAATSGNQVTVRTGSFNAAKYTGYANQSVVTPKTNLKLGQFTLTAASSETINVNTIVVDFDGTNDGSVASKATNVYIVVKNDAGSLIYTSPVKSTVSSTASSSFSVNFSIPVNKTYQVEVWGNLDTVSLTAKTLITHLLASGVTANSSTATTTTEVVGQTITTQTGVLNKANGSLPAARFVNGSSTVTGYQFTLTPTYDDFTLDEVYVDLSSTVASSTGAVSTLQLKNSAGTVLATTTVSAITASASFTGLNLLMLASEGTKTFTVDVVTTGVGSGANDTAGVVTVQLDGLKFRSSAGTITTQNGFVPASFTGNANNVVRGYPTFTNQSLSTTVLNAGTQTLFKTLVTATGGQVSWNDITFTVSSVSAAGTFGPNAAGWKLYENGVDITTFSGSNTASVSDIGSTTRVEFTFAVERVISAGSPVTLELKTTVGGTLATTDSVTTQITNPKGTTVTTDDSINQRGSGASFVWSDQSADSHATTTDDWFTDGMLKALAESQTLTK